jgi:hypothetical protein
MAEPNNAEIDALIECSYTSIECIYFYTMPFLYYNIYKGAFMGVIVREIVYKIKSLYTNQKRRVSAKETQYRLRLGMRKA